MCLLPGTNEGLGELLLFVAWVGLKNVTREVGNKKSSEVVDLGIMVLEGLSPIGSRIYACLRALDKTLTSWA